MTDLNVPGDGELFANIVKSIAAPVFVKDRGRRWIFLNDAYCAFMGYRREELLGKSDHDFFPKEQADRFQEKDEEVFVTRARNLNEETFTDASGVVHTILTSKAVFKNSAGRDVLVGVITDITEIRKTSGELQLFRDLVQNLNDSLFIADPDSAVILDVNKQATESLGYTREEMLGMKVFEYETRLPTMEEWRLHAAEIKRKGGALVVGELKRRDGTVFPVEVNVKYIALDGKEYFATLVRDITERRKMEAAMKELDTLQGLIPICSGCKKIRNDKGGWEKVETYISRHSEAKFSHGLCEACARKLYGDEDWFDAK